MSKVCNSCGSEISWNPKKREELHIRGPLNSDGLTPHYCYDKQDTTNTQAASQPASRPPSNVTDPILIQILAHLSDSIRLLALSNVASTAKEKEEVRHKVLAQDDKKKVGIIQ